MIELLERLGYRPRYAVWELTLACDLRCKHCGSYAGRRRRDELSFEEAMALADDLATMGCEKLTLGGGEPTLHPQWDQIGQRLVERGVRVNIITNGWSWTEAHLQKAIEAGLTNVAFSLDGFEAVHDTIRKPDSFRRVVEATKMNIAGGMPTSVVTHINTLNYKQLPEFRAFLAEIGVSSWQPQLGVPSGSMSEHGEYVLEADDLLWLTPLLAEMRDDDKKPIVFAADNVGYFGEVETKLRGSRNGSKINFWIGCRAGCQVIGIESNGNIKGCLSQPSARHGEDIFLEGNIRDSGLQAIWEGEDSFAYNRKFTVDQLDGFCAVCRYRDICRGGCAWTAYSHTKSRFDNPYCFYRQAVKRRRFDLLGDDMPSPAELSFFGPEGEGEGEG
ncbi:radical SAM protein [Myxococcota bacterium]|nr:radical SAM protein [Myxococcota bacterium]